MLTDISFIGGGKMAEAIISTIIQSEIIDKSNIFVSEPLSDRRSYLETTYGITTVPENRNLTHTGLLIISVKPQNLIEVCRDLYNNMNSNCTIVSIVAGASLKILSDATNHKNVVRVMPNTPAQIGEGMSVWASSDNVPKKSLNDIEEILNSLGQQIFVLDEKYIDMATALSASGPAYVFMFIESLIDAGVHIGMSRDMARTLTLQMVLGSTKFVAHTGLHPASLKDMVTSPGGTTIEALVSMENDGFRATIINAVIAAYDRSKELG
jgi:pyrroline-5-carboxylate reductase